MPKEIEELEYQILYHLRALLKEETPSDYADYLATLGHYISGYTAGGGDFHRLFNYPENVEPVLQSLFMEGLHDRIRELEARYGERFDYFEKVSAEMLLSGGDERGAWETFLSYLSKRFPASKEGRGVEEMEGEMVRDAIREHHLKMDISLEAAIFFLLKDPSPSRIRDFYASLHPRRAESLSYLQSFTGLWCGVEEALSMAESALRDAAWEGVGRAFSSIRGVFKKGGRGPSRELATLIERGREMVRFLEEGRVADPDIFLTLDWGRDEERALALTHLLMGEFPKGVEIFSSLSGLDEEEKTLFEQFILKTTLKGSSIYPPSLYEMVEKGIPLDEESSRTMEILKALSKIRGGETSPDRFLGRLAERLSSDEGREGGASVLFDLVMQGVKAREVLHLLPHFMPSPSSMKILSLLFPGGVRGEGVPDPLAERILSLLEEGWSPSPDVRELIEGLIDSSGRRVDYELLLFLRGIEKMESGEVYSRLKDLFDTFGFHPGLLTGWRSLSGEARAERFFDEEFPSTFLLASFRYYLERGSLDSAFAPFFMGETIGEFMELTGVQPEEIPYSFLARAMEIFEEFTGDEDFLERVFSSLEGIMEKGAGREIMKCFATSALKATGDREERLKRARFCAGRLFPGDEDLLFLLMEEMAFNEYYREAIDLFRNLAGGDPGLYRGRFLSIPLYIVTRMCLSGDTEGAREFLFELEPERWLEERDEGKAAYAFLLFTEAEKRRDRTLLAKIKEMEVSGEDAKFLIESLTILTDFRLKSKESYSSFLQRSEKEIDYLLSERDKVQSELSSFINSFSGRYREALRSGLEKGKDAGRIIEAFEEVYKREKREIPPRSLKASWESKMRGAMPLAARLKGLAGEIEAREASFPLVSGLRLRREGILERIREIRDGTGVKSFELIASRLMHDFEGD